MDGQQILALIIVSLAAVYLGHQFVRSLRAFRSNKPGCGSGCGKCGLAGLSEKRPAAPRRADVIPLNEVRPRSAASEKERKLPPVAPGG
jgi:hypothetical protein